MRDKIEIFILSLEQYKLPTFEDVYDYISFKLYGGKTNICPTETKCQ